jgi:hypothetical protein
MTKDEFGLDLFEAVKTIGGILGVQQQYAGAVHKADQPAMAACLKRRDELNGQLRVQMDKLSDADAAEIARRYPWVLG